MKFLREENVAIFCQNYEIRFHFWPQKSYSFEFISRPSIVSVIRFSNNSITFTDTIVKITKKRHFPWGNCAIEFLRNTSKVAKIYSHEIIVKAKFTKINSREILGKSQMANINYRKMSEKRNSRKLVPVNISCNSLSTIVILRHLSDQKTFKKDHEARKVERYEFYYKLSVENISSTIKH